MVLYARDPNEPRNDVIARGNANYIKQLRSTLEQSGLDIIVFSELPMDGVQHLIEQRLPIQSPSRKRKQTPLTPVEFDRTEGLRVAHNVEPCGYEWTYRGKSPYYGTCPNCSNKVNLSEFRVS